MKSSNVDVDGVMSSLGCFGRFHFTQYILICLCLPIVTTNLFLIVFIGLQPEYQCNNFTDSQLNDYNISYSDQQVVYRACSIDILNINGTSTLPCLNGYNYSTPVNMSIVSEWDLVCSRTGLSESTQALFTIGWIIGGYPFSILIEKYGRKPLHIICNLLLLITNIVCAFSPHILVFATMRLMVGIWYSTYLISGLTIVVEMYPKEKRLLMSGTFSFIWSVLATYPAVSAFVLKDYNWHVYVLFTSSMSAYFIIELLFLKESIRWLFANGKIEQAKEVIKVAAKQNKIDFDTVWDIATKDMRPEQSSIEADTNFNRGRVPGIEFSEIRPVVRVQRIGAKISAFSHLLWIAKTPYMRNISIFITFKWMVINTSYISLYLMSEVLIGSIYLNFVLMALMEGIAAAVYALSITRFGHKIPLSTGSFIGAVFMLSACLLKAFGETNESNENIFVACNLIAMFGIGASYGGLFIYTPELYPTEIRSVGLGMVSSISRCVSMTAPFFKILAMNVPWAPAALIGTGCALAAILGLIILPETHNKQLPQTMKELEETNIGKKPTAERIQTISYTKFNQLYI